MQNIKTLQIPCKVRHYLCTAIQGKKIPDCQFYRQTPKNGKKNYGTEEKDRSRTEE